MTGALRIAPALYAALAVLAACGGASQDPASPPEPSNHSAPASNAEAAPPKQAPTNEPWGSSLGSSKELLSIVEGADPRMQGRLAAQGLVELDDAIFPAPLHKALSFCAQPDVTESQANTVVWEAVADEPDLCRPSLRSLEKQVRAAPKGERAALLAKRCNWVARGLVRAGEENGMMGAVLLAASVRKVLKDQGHLGKPEDALAHLLATLVRDAEP